MTFPSTTILTFLAAATVLSTIGSPWPLAAAVEEAAAPPTTGAAAHSDGGNDHQHLRRLQEQRCGDGCGDDEDNEDAKEEKECKPIEEASSNYTAFTTFTYLGELDTSLPGLEVFLETGYILAYNELVGECDQLGASRELVGADLLEVDKKDGKFLMVASLSCNSCRSGEEGLLLFSGEEATTFAPESGKTCDCPGPNSDDVAELYSKFLNSEDFVIIGAAQPFWEPACTGVGDNINVTTFNNTAVCL
jgi:hypothetical protein